MAGSGSPCGACKFLRRKCGKGCILAPYFSDEEGATLFAAIHKIFGASNISKLLAHLPLSHRSEAALTISYEAQARIQDPIYGCVSHVFALQQQVINLQAQLASLKAQVTAQNFSYSSASTPLQEQVIGRFPSHQEDCDGFFHVESLMSAQPSLSDPSMSVDSMFCYGNELVDPNSAGNHHTLSMTKKHGLNAGSSDSFHFQGMEDLQSAAFSYLNHA